MDIQRSIYRKRTPRPLFPNQETFWLAVAITGLNFVFIASFVVMAQVMRLPDPLTQLAVVGIREVSRALMLASLWSIGNTVLLLAIIDASRSPGKKEHVQD